MSISIRQGTSALMDIESKGGKDCTGYLLI